MEDDKHFADIPIVRSSVYADFHAKMSPENKLAAFIIQNKLKGNKNKFQVWMLEIDLVNLYLTIDPEHQGFLLRKKFLEVRLEWLKVLAERKTTHMAMKAKWKAGVPRHPLAVALVEAFDAYVAYNKQQKNVVQ